MRRALLVLLLCSFPLASAETAYLGLRFAVASQHSAASGSLSLGVQAGVPLSDRLELRAALTTALLNSLVHADALYVQPLGDGLRTYVGAGPEYASVSVGGASGSAASFGVHLTAGLEATDVVGIFAEVQPALAFASSSLWVRLSVGVNYRFE